MGDATSTLEEAEIEHRFTLPLAPSNLTVILAADLAQIVACRGRFQRQLNQRIVDDRDLALSRLL
jgi:hypothetical protein